MNLDEFLGQRRPAWRQLEETVNALNRRGRRRANAEQVYDLIWRYRQASADLARLRMLKADHADITYLNRLVTRAHGQVYRAPTRRPLSVSRFFLVDYPRLVRQTWRFTLASLLISVVFSLMAFVTVQQSPDIVVDVMGGGEEQFTGPKTLEDIQGRFQAIPSPLLSSFVTTNNIKVAFMASAFGITFGLGTLYFLAINGTMLGAYAGAYAQSGIGREFWFTILPHGALELSAIVLAGGSGLLMGYALWCPGGRTRALALRQEATRAVQLVVGLVPAFVVAGMIEGFITPRTDLSATFKVSLGVAVAAVFWIYLLLSGIGARSAEGAATPERPAPTPS